MNTMLDLVVIIAAFTMFMEAADDKGLNKYLWGVIGGVCCLIPSLISRFHIVPYLVRHDYISKLNDKMYQISSSAIILGSGIIVALIAYTILKRKKGLY